MAGGNFEKCTYDCGVDAKAGGNNSDVDMYD